jgi:hypothetical protein
VGVEVVSNFITKLVGLTLAWVTADVVDETGKNCTNDPKNYAVRYYNMSRSLDDLNTTLCFRTTMNFTEAVSPAFVIEGKSERLGKSANKQIFPRLRLVVRPVQQLD